MHGRDDEIEYDEDEIKDWQRTLPFEDICIRVEAGTGVSFTNMSVLLEGALDEELDENLGYSKYDYKNKDTDDSRNGHSSETMHTNYGDIDVEIPRDRNGEYEPQLIKKYHNTVSQGMEEKIISMYAKA